MINALECISKIQKILPEARLSATHENQGVKIENSAFGIIRGEDDKYHLNDAGSLMALVSNDGTFVPDEIFEYAEEIENNLPDGIIFTFTEFMMPLRTVDFPLEELSAYWGKYKEAYEMISSYVLRKDNDTKS